MHETDVWVELTTLLIPGKNDSSEELDAMTKWVAAELGPDVPMHFSAFHPDFKMLDTPPTPPATLTRARTIALGNGIRYAYTGNVHDRAGGSTSCPKCNALVVERDWYVLGKWGLDAAFPAVYVALLAPHLSTRPGRIGALIAFERGDARVRALFREALRVGSPLVIPAGVVGQVLRDGARQVPLRALLNGATTAVPALDRELAEAAGTLCGRTGTSDVIDASVVLVARREGAPVVTSDVDDLRRLDPTLRLERV